MVVVGDPLLVSTDCGVGYLEVTAAGMEGDGDPSTLVVPVDDFLSALCRPKSNCAVDHRSGCACQLT